MGVVGLGTMGAGIAEVFARGGLAVTAVEADPDALSRGIAVLHSSLGRAVTRGKLTEDQYAEIAARVRPAPSVDDLAGADLVIEVVPEQLGIKRQIVAELDKICRPDAIIATNTSSLSVTAIAAGSVHPGRVIGMHFFNPAPVMRLVEVITTVLTDPPAAEAVTALARRLGKTPVQVTDRAGFVANALLLPYLNHAVRLLETGYADREDIDAAATQGIGLPMGPLALLDLIGLDTSLAVLEVLAREFGGTRYTPAPLLRRLVDAGRTGRKNCSGFYDYPPQGTASATSSSVSPNAEHAPAPGTVTLVDPVAGAGEAAGAAGRTPGDLAAVPHGDLAAELSSLMAAAGINVTRNQSHPSDLVVVAIGADGGVLGPALAAGRPADTVGLHLVSAAAPGSSGAGSRPPQVVLAELAPTLLTSARALAAARALVGRLGLQAVRSADRPGLLVGGLLCPHLRDAVVMVADEYATPADVDAAMTLGCGYPRGPMRMLADVGPGQVAHVLGAMQAAFGDPAYAPPPLLAEYARAGLSPAGAAER